MASIASTNLTLPDTGVGFQHKSIKDMSQTYHLVKTHIDGSRSYRMIGQRSFGHRFLFDGKLTPNHSYMFAKLAIVSAMLQGWEILGGYSIEEFFDNIVEPNQGLRRSSSSVTTSYDGSQWMDCDTEWF